MDDDEVLDPHATPAREVYARLDRDDVAGDEITLRGRAKDGQLLQLEPDAVAEPVHDLGDPRPLDLAAGEGVELARVRTGLDLREGRLLRVAADRVCAAKVGGKLTGGERARAVGVVAVELGPASTTTSSSRAIRRSPGW